MNARILAFAAAIAVAMTVPGRPALAAKKTIVQTRIEAAKRLEPLRKVTVGPDDQYNSAIDPSGQWVVYAHKADLAPHLRLQKVEGGDAIDLMPLTADSQEPSFSAGGRLAFTFYKANARGDVCWTTDAVTKAKTLTEGDYKCLQRGPDESDSERAGPFWISEDEIGFVSRPIASQQRSIRAQNLRTGAVRALAQGQVWAPSMKPGGAWLVYNEIVSDNGPFIARRALTVQNLRTGQKFSAFFELPGFSGFPSISDDESFVYFSHYLNDTNGDNTVDGGDNAVVFRAGLAQIVAAAQAGFQKEIFPQQLTSVENSCSYPRPFRDQLYATCAFEGSLDIYRLPATGAVPAGWDIPTLESALRTSRTYQDRILLANALRARDPKRASSVDSLLFANHVLADDVSAAKYYLDRVQGGAAAADKPFYSLLAIYLRGRELRQAQPSEQPSREFQNAISGLDGDAAKVAVKTPDNEGFRSTVRGLLRALASQKREAAAHYQAARAKFAGARAVRPFERALWHELASRVLDFDAKGAGARDVDAAFAAMVAAPELDEQAQLYYAFQYLKQVEAAEGTVAARTARIQAFIKNQLGGKPGPVHTLLSSEETSLRVTQAPDEAAKNKAYLELDKFMMETQKDYFLRRALYVRAILNFAAAADFKYMSLVAGNWLKYTGFDDTEYAYAREVFARASLEEAYGNMASGKTLLANGFFYGSLSLTDDLESHAGYIASTIKLGERSGLEFRYGNLEKREFIGDNMKFVEALLILSDRDKPALEGAGGASGGDVSALDRAIDKLQDMTQDRESAVRRLLLGYCYASKLMRRANGLDFDAKLLDDAHRELMLAYDVGRTNQRVAAAALMNLGLLHGRVQNHALAARFFSLRKRYPFTGPEERARFEALYAQELFRSRQAEAAAEELSSLPNELRSGPVRERRAFYLMAAGQYDDAAKAYAEIWPALRSQKTAANDANLARIGLAYGFSVFKQTPGKNGAAHEAEARQILTDAAVRAGALEPQKKGGERLLDSDPKRIAIAARGLLGQMGPGPDRIRALEERARLLDGAKKSYDDWQAVVGQNQARLAELYLQAGDAARARAAMTASVVAMQSYGEDAGFLGQPVFQAVIDYLALALRKPAAFAGDDGKAIGKLVDSTFRAHDALKTPSPFLDLQRTKAQALWASYSAKVAPGGGTAAPGVDAALAAAPAARAKAALPKPAWAEVEGLARAIR